MTLTPEEVTEIITEIKKYIPVTEDVINEIAPILDKYLNRMLDWSREDTFKSILFYESKGLTRKEAILLTINAKIALEQAIDNMGKIKK